MKQFVKDELEKLFNVTIYNEEFCNLEIMYNRKETANRKFLTDNLESRISENLINFVSYSYGNVKQKLMTRDNNYKLNYRHFINNHPKINTEDLNRRLAISSNEILTRTIIRSDEINGVSRREDIFCDKGYRLDNGNKLKDTFILRNMAIDYYNVVSDELETPIKFLQSDCYTDFPNKISELSFENILCINETVSLRNRNKWYKSIERETLPDMNLIYNHAPEVMKFIAIAIYKDTNLRPDIDLLRSLQGSSFVPTNRNIYSKFINIIAFLNNIVNVNEINSTIDFEKVKYDYFKSRLNSCIVDFSIEKSSISLDKFTDVKIDFKRYFMNHFDELNNEIIDDNINLRENVKLFFKNKIEKDIISELSNHIDDDLKYEIMNKYKENFYKLLDNIEDNMGEINKENIEKYFFNDKVNDKMNNLDDFENAMVNFYLNNTMRINQDNKIEIEDVIEEDFIYKIIDIIRKNNKNIELDATTINFNNLNDNSYNLINDLQEENFLSIKMSPTSNNIDQFTKMSIKDINEFDINYLRNKYDNVYTKLDEIRYTDSHITTINLENFIISFYKDDNNSYPRFISDRIKIINKDLPIEDISLIILLSMTQFEIENDELKVGFVRSFNSPFKSAYDSNGQLFSLNVIKDIFIDGSYEDISNILLLLFSNMKLNSNERFSNDEINLTGKSFLTSKVMYKDEEGNIKSDELHKYISNSKDNLNNEVMNKFRKFRTRYLARNVFL